MFCSQNFYTFRQQEGILLNQYDIALSGVHWNNCVTLREDKPTDAILFSIIIGGIKNIDSSLGPK